MHQVPDIAISSAIRPGASPGARIALPSGRSSSASRIAVIRLAPTYSKRVCPFIARSSYAAIAESLRSGATLVACRYRGRRGHPVGFARAWFAQLQAMNGDCGAKALLEEHRVALTICAVEDPGVVWDIDTPDDLLVEKSQTFNPDSADARDTRPMLDCRKGETRVNLGDLDKSKGDA